MTDRFYLTFIPQFGQKEPPRVSLPQRGHLPSLSGRPQFGQKAAPGVTGAWQLGQTLPAEAASGAPHVTHRVAAGLLSEPHFGHGL